MSIKTIKGILMSKVFITKASTKLIFRGLRNLEDEVTQNDILSVLESDFIEQAVLPEGGFSKYFNKKELKNLYKMKMVLKDLPTLIEKMDDNKDIIGKYIEAENNRFAQRVQAPSYHTHNDCQWLNSDFRNIELPSSIKDKDLKERIRHFIAAQTGKNFEEINSLYKNEFHLIEDLREVVLKNSGVENFDNTEIITDLFLQIKNEFEDMHSILHSGENNSINKKVKNIVYADTWNANKICRNSALTEQDCNDIKKILQTKKDLTETLFTFYKEKYNKYLTFEGTVLDTIGFRVCRGCEASSISNAA